MGYALIAPLVIWLGATVGYPLFEAVRLSFTDAGIIGTAADYVGTENYREALTGTEFLPALARTAVWGLGNALLQTVLALAAALALNARIRARTTARVLLILPWVLPTVVIAIIWRWLLSGTFGIVNAGLKSLGLIDRSLSFLGDPSLAMATLVFINSWRWFPFLTLVILAGLQRVPENELQAAELDGANALRAFRYVTFGYLRPVLVVVGLLGFLWAVNVFDVIWLLTQGGPAGRTATVPVLIYELGFKRFAMGQASAVAVLFFGVLTIVVIAMTLASYPELVRRAWHAVRRRA